MARPREHLGITIDLSRDTLLSDFAKSLLNEYYCRKDEKSPQYAFGRAAVAYCGGDLKLAQRIYDYASQNWFMYASPVLSNAVHPGEPLKALPISCFLTYVPDTLEGLISHTSELRWLSVKGGGVGGHWSDVRSVSNVAPGPISSGQDTQGFIRCISGCFSSRYHGVSYDSCTNWRRKS
jgi:ribonucleoside-diphosphate reductase alpha chain